MRSTLALGLLVILGACGAGKPAAAPERFVDAPTSATAPATALPAPATFTDVVTAFTRGGLTICEDHDDGAQFGGAYDSHSYSLSAAGAPCPERGYGALVDVAIFNTKSDLMAASQALPGEVIQEWAIDGLVVSVYGSSKPAELGAVRRVMAAMPRARETAKRD